MIIAVRTMEDIEVPPLFTCPISLLIMRDPVTVITGITYDRNSIEHWLFSDGHTTCPVTKQPLPPPGSGDLTPNHTLRRLIQAWCIAHGVDRIPTPKPPLDRPRILTLLRDILSPATTTQPQLRGRAVGRLASLAAESGRNQKLMAGAGVPKALCSFVSTHCRHGNRTEALEEALDLLRLLLLSKEEAEDIGDEVTDSLTWVLASERVSPRARAVGIAIAEAAVAAASSAEWLSRLKPEFLAAVVGILRSANQKRNQEEARSAIRIMLLVAPHRNRAGLVEAGAVEELVKAEVEGEEKGVRRTEEVIGVLSQLCFCAEGRERVAGHGSAVAVVAERMVRVSGAVDEGAVVILSALSKFSGTKRVAREMLEVGAVAKLCFLVQMDCPVYVKNKARELLKTHSSQWKHSPCLAHHFHHYPN